MRGSADHVNNLYDYPQLSPKISYLYLTSSYQIRKILAYLRTFLYLWRTIIQKNRDMNILLKFPTLRKSQ